MKAQEKLFMWYKVKKLYEQDGLNKSQIAREIGIDRATVRRYLSMDEDTFHKWLSKPKHLPPKLAKYYNYVLEELRIRPYLSSAQIEDRLKEHFDDLPAVHSKTVYNFVCMIRKREGIKKPKSETPRDYEKLPEVKYGQQAQVDFGEYAMKDPEGRKNKVYFFVMILSRSRYKFVHFQNAPFTSATAIHAHKLAFDYFQGMPKEIIYDQDTVFMRDENLGDFLLTEKFSRFLSSQPFYPVFCRKADPESKGKVENVVGYVKKNFLRGRNYTGIDTLNQMVLEWLSRTGNRKVHGTTHKIPTEQWKIEQQYLIPLTKQVLPERGDELKTYKLRKDNTVCYRGNFYTVPTGTYINSGSKVLLKAKNGSLTIYNMKKEIIASHTLSCLKGKLIRKNDHLRDKTTNIKEKEKQALNILGQDNSSKRYLQALKRDKPRYYHDHLRAIINKLKDINKKYIHQAIGISMERGIYNSNQLEEIALYCQKMDNQESPQPITKKVKMPDKADINPENTDITKYESIM